MTLIGNTACSLNQGNLLHSMDVGVQYTVKFQIYPYNFHGFWRHSVIHFAGSRRSTSTYGDQILAVFLTSKTCDFDGPIKDGSDSP